VIEAQVAELLESPCALIVGTVSSDLQPDATRGWGLAVAPAGDEIRLLLAANAERSLRNVHDTGRLAVTATNFRTLESVQVKGRVLRTEPRDGDDVLRFNRFCAGCVRAIHDLDQTPEDIIWRFMPADVVACVVAVEALYDQTPGPSAGERLTAGRRR
jgi:hypothetical protein